MTFVVIFIALVIERFFDWSHLRRWAWYAWFEHWMVARLPGKSPYLVLSAAILPILIGVVLIQIILDNAFYGLPKLLFELFILIYCLGPQNFWADTFSVINAFHHGDLTLAREKLKTTFDIAYSESTPSLHTDFIKNIFIEANKRVFAVIFWFFILGPVGAVLYRSLTLSRASFALDAPEFSARAHGCTAILDWLPIRLLTCLFALGGHFSRVFSQWPKLSTQGPDKNELMLVECGVAALGMEANVLEGGSLENSAVNLVDRALVITLVIIAIFVIFSVMLVK